MPRSADEKDLFQDSTMTFGEHLEELRVCLFKAIVGLAVGCAIGLLVGGPVVHFIQTPLHAALEEYYQNDAIKRSFDQAELEKLARAGYAGPEGIKRFQQILQGGKDRKDPFSYKVEYVDPEGPQGVLVAGRPDPATLEPVVFFHRLAEDSRTQASSLNAQEGFMIYLKTSLLVGAVLASPWVFLQIWTFVAAGLYPREKRYVHVFLPFSVALFLAGMATAFFFVFQPVLNFLLGFNSMLGINPEPRINEWMGFVLLVPLAFGIGFQLPLAMLFMERIGIFTAEAYLSYWRVAILAIFVLAMLILPTGDPYSLLIMAGAMTLLYFVGILLCRFMPRRPSAFEET